jgi:hypothetical protein
LSDDVVNQDRDSDTSSNILHWQTISHCNY